MSGAVCMKCFENAHFFSNIKNDLFIIFLNAPKQLRKTIKANICVP